MSTLYHSGYRPPKLPKKYEACSVCIEGKGQAADRLRCYGVPAEWGDPTDAVAFFDEGSGSLMAMVADYDNGRRVEFRRHTRDFTLTFKTAQAPRP